MLEVTDIRKRFGAVTALRGASFTAPNGEVTGLLGPNGAGKTTALRIVYGALKADTGTALVDGIDASLEPRKAQARLGVLPHSHGLYTRLTTRENVAYFAGLHGMSKADAATAIERLSGMLDMDDIMDRRTGGFSQGQRVKVAIARALVHDPPNVILDEPTNGLDVMSTRAMREVIRGLRDDGRCVLFSSHVMQEVAALCDRIVVIASGGIAAIGTPAEIKAQTGKSDLEDAFVSIIGSEEGLS